MLRKINENEFEKYIDFAYDLALDLSKSAFPIYTDGVKDKTYFYEVAKRGIERVHHEILLFEKDGVVEGWIHYYYLDEDKYIGVNTILVRNGYVDALEELFAYWKNRFTGYSWNMYLPDENQEALFFMRERGYADQGQEYVNVLLFDNYIVQQDSKKVISVGKDNFELFCSVHSQFETDMYWTSERIEKHMEDWEIFAYVKDEKCLGAVYYNGKGEKDLEIFGIDVIDSCEKNAVIEKLLISCLNHAKRNGAKSMYFFNEDAFTQELVVKVGFDCKTVAHYFLEEL